MNKMRRTLRNHMWRNRCLPYGMWTCEDGRQVLFNRDYKPIFQRVPGAAATQADSAEWVRTIRKEEWFYTDGKLFAASVKAACAVLDSWGVEIPAVPVIARKVRAW